MNSMNINSANIIESFYIKDFYNGKFKISTI